MIATVITFQSSKVGWCLSSRGTLTLSIIRSAVQIAKYTAQLQMVGRVKQCLHIKLLTTLQIHC